MATHLPKEQTVTLEALIVSQSVEMAALQEE